MSGIAGVWHMDGAGGSEDAIGRMLRTLAHRGPDGAGSWADAQVALGHQKLATTPESLRETLPLSNLDGTLRITADARLDNREELADELGADLGAALPSDAALVLLAYARWGERCVEQLLGDFAFAVWDARRSVLFCARDRFGVKPFYYHHRRGQLFAFASEIKAILALESVPRRLNETRIADFLVQLYEDRVQTLYDEVFRLPPAHTLRVDREGITTGKYWELESGREIRYASDEAYAEAFRHFFARAVRTRVRSAGPVGSMLSGGLDSSSVACMAVDVLAEQGLGPLHTYSNVFERSTSADERTHIQIVLDRGGMEPHWVNADEAGPLSGIEHLLPHLDEPPFAANTAASVGLYARASGDVRVLLDGLHGDNTLFSYGDLYLAELLRRGRLLEVARLLRAYDRHHPGRAWHELKSYGIKPLLPPAVLARWRRLRGRTDGSRNPLIDPEFAGRMDVEGRRRRQHAAYHEPFVEARQVHRFELTAGMTTAALELADAIAAHHGVEPRYPFLDRSLIEYCFGVPSEQKFLGGWPRSLLRRGLAGVLPDAIRWRRGKRGTAEWYLRGLFERDREAVESLANGGGAALAGWVDRSGFVDTCAAFLSEPTQATADVLWAPLVLASWLARHEPATGG